MKRIFTLLSGLMLTAAVAFGQNYNWAHGYTIPQSYLKPVISPDNNGGAYVVTNFHDSINPDPNQPLVYQYPSLGNGAAFTRIDANGNLVYANILEIGNAEYNIYDVLTLSDNSYYVIGSVRIYSSPVDINPSSTASYMINTSGLVISHFSASGNLLNVKKLNIETYLMNYFESKISANDELLISGTFSYGAHFSEIPGQDTTYAAGNRTVYTAKYDNNLDLIWVDYFQNDHPVSYTKPTDGVNALKSNGNVVVVYTFGGAITLSNLNNYTPVGVYDMIILEYDVSGNIINDIVISSTGDDDYPNDIAIDSHDNIALMGFTRDSVDIDVTNASTNYTKVKYSYLAYYDSNFNLLHFKNGSMGNTIVKEMEFTGNNELIVTGSFFNTFDFSFDNSFNNFYKLTSNSNYDVFLAKYDTSLTVHYAHKIGNSSNTGDVFFLRLDDNDDIFMTGNLGAAATDMNFGPLEHNIDGFANTYSFAAKYQLCSTVEVIQNVGVCPGDSYTFPDGSVQNNINFPVSKTYRTVAVSSCDSVIITNITINPTYNITHKDSVCPGDSYTYPDGFVQNNITSLNSHTSNLQTILGCDSIVNSSIYVRPTYNVSETNAVCNGASYTFPDGSTQNNISSQVVQVSNLQSVNGCDSIVTTTVEVINVDTTITQNADTFMVNQSGATYQWYNCSDSQPVSGAMQQSYHPSSSGSYQVEVTYNGCMVTSSCESIILTGIDYEDKNLNITVYPNPTNGIISINIPIGQQIESIKLFNIEGKEVIVNQSGEQGNIRIDLSAYADGVYFVQILSEKSIKTFRILKN